MDRWKDWQILRVAKSRHESIACDVWDELHGTYLFGVIGTTGEPYDVTIDPDIWPPSCTCLDNTFRPLLCKHICFVLVRLGAREDLLADPFWSPAQDDIYELLANAAEVIE